MYTYVCHKGMMNLEEILSDNISHGSLIKKYLDLDHEQIFGFKICCYLQDKRMIWSCFSLLIFFYRFSYKADYQNFIFYSFTLLISFNDVSRCNCNINFHSEFHLQTYMETVA